MNEHMSHGHTQTVPSSAIKEEVSLSLPSKIGIWSRPESSKRIRADNIFDYMDGAGELYIGYRFRYLDVFEYSSSDQDQIIVELYWMETAGESFGLMSNDWGGEPVPLSDSGEGAPKDFPDALYGAGLLRMRVDNLYARVMALRETAASKKAVLELGRLIAAGRKNQPPPAMVKALPASFGNNLTLRKDRVCYFRSHLVLNSIYFLSTRNILNLDRTVEVVAVSYEQPSMQKKNSRVQLILIRYATIEAANNALKHFIEIYIPEKTMKPTGSSTNFQDFIRIEDGWMGFGLSGKNLCLVFETSTIETAQTIINDSVRILDSLEVSHER